MPEFVDSGTRAALWADTGAPRHREEGGSSGRAGVGRRRLTDRESVSEVTVRIGIPVWGKRVSPVLDASGELLVVEFSDKGRTDIGAVPLGGWGMMRRARLIGELGLDVLICGAISGRLAGLLGRTGVRVMAWVSGDVDEVLQAFSRGELASDRFAMPGRRHVGRGVIEGGRLGGRGRRGG